MHIILALRRQMKEDPKEDPKFKDSLAKTAKLHRKRRGEGGKRGERGDATVTPLHPSM